jgi:hypothetical protein
MRGTSSVFRERQAMASLPDGDVVPSRTISAPGPLPQEIRSWLVGTQGPGFVCVPGAAAAAVTTESATRAAARVRTGIIGKVLSKGKGRCSLW